MLTPDGLRLIWEVLTDQAADSLDGGSIVVSDGAQTASAPIEGDAPTIEVDGAMGSITVSATFGEDDANFEWTRRQVVTRAGVVFDDETEDGGRKVQGSIWTVEATIELSTAQGD